MATSSRPARLNPRQGLFVEHYLIDLNGKAAAMRAGYTPAAATVRAAKLLRQPAVRQQIAAAMAARAARAQTYVEGGITAERVIAEYACIAFADWRHFADWGPTQVRFAAMRALSADDRAAVAEIVAAPGGLKRLKLFDKQAALDSLSRILAHADRARFRVGVAQDAAPPVEPNRAAAPRPLSARQRRFAAAFLDSGNASAAARRAGYAPTSAPFLATRLRRYPGVAARIEAGFAAKRRSIRIAADRVLAEYARIAFADISRVAEWSSRQLRIKPQRRVALADSAAVERVDAFRKRAGARGRKLRLTLYDKVYALDMLARHLGLLDPRMPGGALKQKYAAQRTSAMLRGRLGQA